MPNDQDDISDDTPGPTGPLGSEDPGIPDGERPPADTRSVDVRNPHMKRGESKSSERRIAAREKAAQALTFRKMGASYSDIAEKCGYNSPQAAHEAVMASMRRLTEEPAKEVMRLELERLDELMYAPYTKALAGDLYAVRSVLDIMDRRARLLGINAPERSEITGKGGVPLGGLPTGVLVVPGMAANPEEWARVNAAYGQSHQIAADAPDKVATPSG